MQSKRPNLSLKVVIVCLTAVAAISLSAIAINRTAPAISSVSAAPILAYGTPLPTTPSVRVTLPSAGGSVLFFGDSYTEGFGSSNSATLGFAPLVSASFGWKSEIDGVGGSGFVTKGPANETYADRLASRTGGSAQLIVLQGGLNDEKSDAAQVEVAARADIARLHTIYPSAQIVVVGPVSPYREVPTNLASIDSALGRAAGSAGVAFVSPIVSGWNVAPFTENDARHPNDSGYALIASKLGAWLRASAA
jgi:acyl-CoA thioesterase-1